MVSSRPCNAFYEQFTLFLPRREQSLVGWKCKCKEEIKLNNKFSSASAVPASAQLGRPLTRPRPPPPTTLCLSTARALISSVLVCLFPFFAWSFFRALVVVMLALLGPV